jgi:hypothetical protein
MKKDYFKPSYIKTESGYYRGKVIGKHYSFTIRILRINSKDAINDAKLKIDCILNASNNY